MKVIMTVDEFAAILLDDTTQIEDAGSYWNSKGKQGYWAHLFCRNQRYWFSVSASNEPVSLADAATAIMSPDRVIEREGCLQTWAGV